MQITREEWAQHLVDALDTHLFGGDLDLIHHQYQIGFGRCKGKRECEVVQQSEAEDIGMDDFFPTTIALDWKVGDVEKIAVNLAFICVQAFLNIKPKGKQYKRIMDKYYFETPYNEPNPSQYCKDLIQTAIGDVEKQYGKFPGKAVKFPAKMAKEKKKTRFNIFCPGCGFELVASKKMLEKNNWNAPTCACGTKMIIEMDDIDEKNKENKDKEGSHIGN